MTDPVLPPFNAIEPPQDGWKEDHVYLVLVSYNDYNVVHRALLHVGFLHDGLPGNYSEIWHNSYDRPMKFGEAFYLKALKTVCTAQDMHPEEKT